MKIALAFDSFKESLSNYEIHQICMKVIREHNPNIIVESYPLADGGEGTREILKQEFSWSERKIKVKDVLGEEKQLTYLKKNNAVYLEVADILGMELLKDRRYDPMEINSYCLGLWIQQVLKQDEIEDLYIGIGGTATNDAGLGMLSAFGYSFLDDEGRKIQAIPAHFPSIKKVEKGRLPKVKVHILSDVENVLCGLEGATYTFGSQKKYTELMSLDREIERIFSEIDARLIGEKSAGCGGGLGAALMLFDNHQVYRGIDFILEQYQFQKKMFDVDLLILGEGKIDDQTLKGKTISGALNSAQGYAKKIIAIVGSKGDGYQGLYEQGLDSVFSIQPGPMSLEDSLIGTEKYIEDTLINILRLIGE